MSEVKWLPYGPRGLRAHLGKDALTLFIEWHVEDGGLTGYRARLNGAKTELYPTLDRARMAGLELAGQVIARCQDDLTTLRLIPRCDCCPPESKEGVP
jgi:hypothetical protein